MYSSLDVSLNAIEHVKQRQREIGECDVLYMLFFLFWLQTFLLFFLSETNSWLKARVGQFLIGCKMQPCLLD